MNTILMLEDGTIFKGESSGASGERVGKIIMNTAVVGYQEILTDPANAGKILVLTYPLIGNYGCAPKFNESKNVWLAGLVIKEESRIFSNWQAKSSLLDFIKKYNLITIKEVDTRSLAVHLRKKGEMLGIISTLGAEPKELLAKINAFRKNKTASFLPEISVNRIIRPQKAKKKNKKIAVLDLGITKSILRQLEALDFSVTLLPYHTCAEEILKLKPDGLIISNGPEEDIALKEIAANLRTLIAKLPILAISTGHQVLAAALGAKLTKMTLGHRGLNYPIYNPGSYKGEITTQNHSYVVDIDSLNKIKGVKITGYNLNDRTVEEMESKKFKFMSIQYYPASPGCQEVNPIFKRFMKIL